MDSWYVDEFARNIMNSKYIGDFTDPFSYYESLAKLVALGDKSLEKSFFRLLWDKRFSPGGRILAYAGRTQSSMSLMNCTTHSVEGDNLEDIANAAYTIMRASSRGQGIGIDLSTLRPKDAPVNNAARTSTGAISFMEMFNGIGATIGQEGRRAALLFTMRIDHPDIWREDGYDFLNIKRMPGKVENANISVLLTDDFMKAVAMDQPWYLRYHGVSGKGSFDIGREVRARDLFQAIAASTLASAEPGVLYWDNTVRMSNSDLFGEQWKVVGMNACTEATLDQEGICDLGSMNLLYYVRDPFTEYSWFDHSSFRRDVGTAIEFLDNVLTVEMMTNNHATERQRESIENLRRIGLGVMGLADTFAAVGIRYGEQDSFRLAEEIFRSMRNAAYAKSVSLAKEKGPAKVWLDALRSGSVSEIVNSGFYATLSEAAKISIAVNGMRNVTVLSIAPTGTIANLLGVSSGIEPLFAKEYTRRVRMNGSDELIDYVHPGVVKSRGMGVSDDIWVTAYEVTPYEHVRMQATIQEYVDQSISKTVNLPAGSTVEDVEDAYMLGWELGLKGMAIYVDGSRNEQVLYVKKADGCPLCGTEIIRKEGCQECPSCGWGLCG